MKGKNTLSKLLSGIGHQRRDARAERMLASAKTFVEVDHAIAMIRPANKALQAKALQHRLLMIIRASKGCRHPIDAKRLLGDVRSETERIVVMRTWTILSRQHLKNVHDTISARCAVLDAAPSVLRQAQRTLRQFEAQDARNKKSRTKRTA